MSDSLKCSVIVPTYRRADLLARCLGALAQQTYPRSSYEVVVADDADSPETAAQIQAASAALGISIRYVGVTGRHGPAAARNAGWRAARGSVIAFTDDDCLPQPEWLAAGIDALRASQAGAAWGRLTMPIPDRPTDYERDAAGLASAVFVTANCFCLRAALEHVGGFDEDFTAAWREDTDLYFRLLDSGQTVVHAPLAHVVHPIRPAAWGVSLRQQRKSQFDVLLRRKDPQRYRAHVPPYPRNYVWIGLSLLILMLGVATGYWIIAAVSGVVWLLLTAVFCLHRLRGTSRAPGHILEMAITSALIPPLSLYWRAYGELRFRHYGRSNLPAATAKPVTSLGKIGS